MSAWSPAVAAVLPDDPVARRSARRTFWRHCRQYFAQQTVRLWCHSLLLLLCIGWSPRWCCLVVAGRCVAVLWHCIPPPTAVLIRRRSLCCRCRRRQSCVVLLLLQQQQMMLVQKSCSAVVCRRGRAPLHPQRQRGNLYATAASPAVGGVGGIPWIADRQGVCVRIVCCLQECLQGARIAPAAGVYPPLAEALL